MIKVNDKIIEKKNFPDGTQLLMGVDIQSPQSNYRILWKYEDDSECMLLWNIVHHIRTIDPYATNITLHLPYVPNARMDRVKSDKEVFTLKYFAEFINSLNFKYVYVLDPHSDVTPALINNVRVESPLDYIKKTYNEITDTTYLNYARDPIYVYFPDAGAQKRYIKIFEDVWFDDDKKPIIFIHGEKIRDWETGEIKGIQILDRDGERVEGLNFCTVLMIDDIISYGGTLAYSADKLKELGAGDIYAYATHTENSVLDEEKGTLLKRIKKCVVKKIFTTDSIFRNPDHPNFNVFEI